MKTKPIMNKGKLLVVDDIPANREILEKSLTRSGYLVLTAENGRDGRIIAREYLPDLILLDIQMPGETGLETIQKLKDDPVTRDIPVIFVTAQTDTEFKVAGFDFGAVDYISKPFDLPEVKARIRRHLKTQALANSRIKEQEVKLKQIRDAQESMLIEPESLPEARFGVHYNAYLEAGGDFYDVFKVTDQVWGYFLADVSGHDIGTSFITAAINALIKQNCVKGHDPEEAMRTINRVLMNTLPKGRYLTACYLLLDRNGRSVRVVNMGHPPVLFVPKDGEARLVESEGDILGVFKRIHLESGTMEIQRGDRFFLYSDGLVERGRIGKLWSECVETLPSFSEYLRDPVPIQKAADNLYHLNTMNLDDPDDDVVILSVEV